jgi:hypothetical protein
MTFANDKLCCSPNQGGGLDVSLSAVNASNFYLARNGDTMTDGAFRIMESNVSLVNSDIVNNAGKGASIDMTSSNAILTNVVFANNNIPDVVRLQHDLALSGYPTNILL